MATCDTMKPCALSETGFDIDLPGKTIHIATGRRMSLEVEGLSRATQDTGSPERINRFDGVCACVREKHADASRIPKRRKGCRFPGFLKPRQTTEKAPKSEIPAPGAKTCSLAPISLRSRCSESMRARLGGMTVGRRARSIGRTTGDAPFNPAFGMRDCRQLRSHASPCRTTVRIPGPVASRTALTGFHARAPRKLIRSGVA